MKFIRQLIARWKSYRRSIDSYATLRGLDTHALRDIGLDRSQLGRYY